MQLPSNMILTRVRPSLYIPLWVCIWSCLSAATAAVHNYGQLVAIRFCLGFAEAPFFPGAFYLLSCWYTKKELALRTAVVYSGLVLATAFSGLLAAGIFAGLDGARGLEGWRWLFIIEGAGSFAAGVISISLIPDFPQSLTGSAKWLLSTEERELAWIRIRNDQVSNQESNDSVWFGLKSALSDYRVFVFVRIVIPFCFIGSPPLPPLNDWCFPPWGAWLTSERLLCSAPTTQRTGLTTSTRRLSKVFISVVRL